MIETGQVFYDQEVATDPMPPAGGQLETIGGRYRIEGPLGQGGMAVVYRALDLSTGKRIALKQMRAPDKESRRAHMTELFEREFLTLAQLAHPRVVEAYDYGLDIGGPYYTMELLDGGDLEQLAPLDWRKACALARDVCSALSLLHSRRLVYRDLSPRNIRCTGEGSAKLIDFGGMAPMGPNPDVIGTPPCAAPEVLDGRPVDARTDLYALGATLYFALVRRQAYPARGFAELWQLWRTRPLPPSAFVAQVPEALDRLVMDLLQADPAHRPVSAAEVMERLNAIVGLPPDEHLRVHQAYLSTPNLVGRAAQLASLRERTLLGPEQRGASVLIHGPEGAGRSRLLEACALQAKLAGMIVLRADAVSGAEAPYAVVRALVAQLLETARELALEKVQPYGAQLSHVLPELTCAAPGDAAQAQTAASEDAAPLALRAWLSAVAEQRPLLLAIDDVARIDERSAACISLLAEEAWVRPLSVVTTATSLEVRSKQRRPLLSLLSRLGTLIELAPLDTMQTKELLGSVFGDAPNLHALASYVVQVAGGNPRDIMRLAQHLIGEGLIRYQCGSWSLPERLPTDRLPSSMTEAWRARLERLSARARRVAYAFACEAGFRFSFDECQQLSEVDEPSEVLQTLRELLDSAVIMRVGPRYRLAQLGFFELFATALPETELVRTHLCLAAISEQRADGIRAAQHLFRAGEEERGLSALVDDAVRSELRTNVSSQAFFELLKMLPKDWLAVYDQALQLCEKNGRAHKERDILLSRLNGLVSHAERDTKGFAYLRKRLTQLERDAGLDLYAALPESMPPAKRLRQAFAAAALRYQQTPAHERVLAPLASIKPLATTLLAALGTIAATNDYGAFQQLPSLGPLSPLSPAIMVVDQIAQGLGARLTGCSEQAIAIYETLLARMEQPDRAGLQVSEHLVCRLRVLLSTGALEASMGLRCALDRVQLVQSEPDYETQALMLLNLCQLWQGQTEEAARTQRRLEIRKTLSSAHHGYVGQYLLSELCAYALADDLTHVKQATETISSHAATHPAWLPVLHYARGEYHRICSDGERALEELQRALKLMDESYHQVWPNAAGAVLRSLVELRRYDEAVRLGEGYLAKAEGRGIGYVASYVRMPLSLALCGAGEHERAVALADAVLRQLEGLGSTGLNLALAYQARARVALAADDETGFQRYAALSAGQWPSGAKRLLGARDVRLRKHTRRSLVRQVGVKVSELRPAVHEQDGWSSCRVTMARDSGDAGNTGIEPPHSSARGRRASVGSSAGSTQDE